MQRLPVLAVLFAVLVLGLFSRPAEAQRWRRAYYVGAVAPANVAVVNSGSALSIVPNQGVMQFSSPATVFSATPNIVTYNATPNTVSNYTLTADSSNFTANSQGLNIGGILDIIRLVQQLRNSFPGGGNGGIGGGNGGIGSGNGGIGGGLSAACCGQLQALIQSNCGGQNIGITGGFVPPPPGLLPPAQVANAYAKAATAYAEALNKANAEDKACGSTNRGADTPNYKNPDLPAARESDSERESSDADQTKTSLKQLLQPSRRLASDKRVTSPSGEPSLEQLLRPSRRLASDKRVAPTSGASQAVKGKSHSNQSFTQTVSR